MIDLGIVVPAYKLPDQEALQRRFVDSARKDARPKAAYEILFVTPERFCITTIIDGREIFNIAKAYNAGLQYFKDRARFIACADIDLIFPPGFIDYAIQKAEQKPHCHRVRLIDPADIVPRNWPQWAHLRPRPGTGAWNVMRYDDYLEIGGFCEDMYGWGGIDTDFKQRKLDRFGVSGCWYDADMALMHVNHPPNTDNAPRRPTENMVISQARRREKINWLDPPRAYERPEPIPGPLPIDAGLREYLYNPDWFPYVYPRDEPPGMPGPEPEYRMPHKPTPAGRVNMLDNDEPVIVLAVLRAGWIDYNQKEFGPEYVRAMAGMLARNVARPYEFWCVTDLTVEVQALECCRVWPLGREDFTSKYCKLELFRPDIHAAAAGRRIISIDLDTVIVGNIDDILGYGGPFAMLGHPRIAHWGLSGMMSFPAGSVTCLYEKFAAWPEHYKEYYPLYNGRGDQLWINRQLPVLPHVWQGLFPGRIMDFSTVPGDGPKKEVSIVYFWGKDTPEKHLGKPWVRKNWLA